MTTVSGERRLRSERLTQVRDVQRDRAYIEQVSFPPFKAPEAATFEAWWREDLLEGGAWFSALWPHPTQGGEFVRGSGFAGGYTATVRRFVGTPQWTFLGNDIWQITAVFEVRGEGELPMFPDTGPALPATGFLDTFTGSVGPLTAHTPDIAPEGFAYFNSKTGPNTDLQLDGLGHTVPVPVGYATAGVADSTASDPPFVMELNIPYTVTMVARPSDTLDNAVILFKLRSEDNSSIDLALYRNPGPYYFGEVYVINNANDCYFYASSDYSDTAVEHTMSVYVEATQATFTFDGVTGDPVPLDGAPPTGFIEVRLLVDRDYPTDGAYLSKIEVVS